MSFAATLWLQWRAAAAGLTVRLDDSVISRSQYLSIVRRMPDPDFPGEYFDGDEITIRVSDHELPPSYAGSRGQHMSDVDVRSSDRHGWVGSVSKERAWRYIEETLLAGVK